MPTPRKRIVDGDAVGSYHLISRCVRQCRLCGDGLEHRRDWIEDRIAALQQSMAIDLTAWNILSLITSTSSPRIGPISPGRGPTAKWRSAGFGCAQVHGCDEKEASRQTHHQPTTRSPRSSGRKSWGGSRGHPPTCCEISIGECLQSLRAASVLYPPPQFACRW